MPSPKPAPVALTRETAAPATVMRKHADVAVPKPFSTRNFMVQRALEVGAADDPYEREADQMADRVVDLLLLSRDPGVATPAASAPTRVRRSLSARTYGAGAAFDRWPAPSGLVRRKQTEVRRMVAPVVGREGGMIDGSVESKIRAAGSGKAMDPTLRRGMEGAFGADFGSVRVHTDSAVAPEIGASAFTHGHDVHFAPGTYSPRSASGQRLIAHELTHTLQQGG